MKKLLILPFLFLGLILFRCNSVPVSESGELNAKTASSDSITCENSTWLDAMLESLKNSGQKAEVIQYTYAGKTVYYIDSCKGCADSMQIVYSCTGEELCKFGGIAGFNTCPDFPEKATDKKVIWQN